MTTTNAFRLYEHWVRLSEPNFEALTFGELKVGQCFIFLPRPERPGVGIGPSGLRSAYSLYIKKAQRSHCKAPSGSSGPHGSALKLKDKSLRRVSNSELVILVE